MAVSLREVLSFGRYEPLFRIASGGMAEVYAARIRGEAGFQKLVAVKRMHPHMASDAGFVDMFLNEARLAANIASPYVVQTLDLGRSEDGGLYIVMELVVGVSLAQLEELLGGPLPPPIALELMAQAAQGVDDAHEATTPAGDPLGLIHRDVSPHNILVGLDGRARVTDFGIARAVHRPRAETNVKELKGKFAYMSPEQTRLLPLDRRSDVFSLGIVVWEELMGRRLFADRDPTQIIRNVRNKVVPPPEGVPEAVSDVVLKALDRHRDHRYQSAAELAEDLRRVGREAYGRLPDRKAIGAFVRKAGGEELERLQRLIRLGTEGADPEAIEKVRPGVTQVSGVAVSGIAASGVAQIRRPTERLEEELPKVPTVTLPPEDDTQAGALDGEVPTDVLLMQEGEFAPPTRDLRRRPPKAPPPTRARMEDGPPTVNDKVRKLPPPGEPTRPYEKVEKQPPAAPAPVVVSASAAWTWMVIGVLAGVALVSGTIAVWVFWPEEPARVPLPLEPHDAPEPVAPERIEPETPPRVEIIEPPEPEVEEETEAPAPPRRRRPRPRRAPRQEPPSGPELMGVDAFDRHAP